MYTVKGMILLPRRRAVGARESSVAGFAARRWRRRHLLREAASEGPSTVRSAGGGGMFGAHGKIAYPSLPFCALMRALTRTAASLLVDAAEAEPATAAVLELAELVQFAVVVT